MPTTKRPPSKKQRSSRETMDFKLRQENKQLRRERDDAFEQQRANGEILRMIARAPTDLQSVMDSIAENAAQLCDAVDAMVWRVDGDVLRLAAHYGSIRSVHDLGGTDSLNRDGPWPSSYRTPDDPCP